MKKENLEILEKQIKTCSECGKKFLAIGINPGSRHDPYPSIYKYDFKCNKCPKCAENCCELHKKHIKIFTNAEEKKLKILNVLKKY